MKTRPIVLMIITLIIGIFIGVLASAELRHKRMRPVRIYTSERQMREFVSRVLQPDEEQMKVLAPVFRKYGRQSMELQKEFRDNFETIMDNYWEELKPLLNPEQIARLNEFENRRRDAVKRFSPDSLRDGRSRSPGRSEQGYGRDGGRYDRNRDSFRKRDSSGLNDSTLTGHRPR